MEEEWRSIREWVGVYEVSSRGRIRSLDRVVYAVNGAHGAFGPRRLKGKILRPGVSKNGYPLVSFTAPGGRRAYCHVHRLVAEAFLGDCPTGQEVCHNNRDRTDNRLENLRYDTRSGNAQDRHLHGTFPSVQGERCGSAKLNDHAVRTIRALKGKVSQRVLGELYGVSHTVIGYAQRRVWWRHVP